MPSRADQAMKRTLALTAPGTPLRDGLDRILQAKMGALVVVGDGPAVLSVCSGGFLLDAEYSPQRLSELAKMDGAIILAADASRIARANVHLLPDPGVPTAETGTRHRTAERVARSIDVPVISVSERMTMITLYRRDHKHVIEPVGSLLDRATTALATLERYRARLEGHLRELSRHEVDDQATVRDVAEVLQRAELVRRIAEEIEAQMIELGDEGRLVRLQLEELMAGLDEETALVLRDYGNRKRGNEARRGGVAALSNDDLVELPAVARAAGLPEALAQPVRARGYRLLARIPRLSESVVEHVVAHFESVPAILEADAQDFIEVEGVGEVRARTLQEGLVRVADALRGTR